MYFTFQKGSFSQDPYRFCVPLIWHYSRRGKKNLFPRRLPSCERVLMAGKRDCDVNNFLIATIYRRERGKSVYLPNQLGRRINYQEYPTWSFWSTQNQWASVTVSFNDRQPLIHKIGTQKKKKLWWRKKRALDVASRQFSCLVHGFWLATRRAQGDTCISLSYRCSAAPVGRSSFMSRCDHDEWSSQDLGDGNFVISQFS